MGVQIASSTLAGMHRRDLTVLHLEQIVLQVLIYH